jgi:hypothetical protein
MERVRVRRVPGLRHHKGSGLAVVTLDGRDIYVGKYGTPEAKAEYDRVMGEWLTSGHALAEGRNPDLTVNELLLAYRRHTKEYYKKNGRPTSEQHCIKRALVPVRRLYGLTPAKNFGPRALVAVRQAMVNEEWARTTVNAQVGRVKRLFKWAAEQELVPGTVHHALSAVAGLRRDLHAARRRGSRVSGADSCSSGSGSNSRAGSRSQRQPRRCRRCSDDFQARIVESPCQDSSVTLELRKSG